MVTIGLLVTFIRIFYCPNTIRNRLGPLGSYWSQAHDNRRQQGTHRLAGGRIQLEQKEIAILYVVCPLLCAARAVETSKECAAV